MLLQSFRFPGGGPGDGSQLSILTMCPQSACMIGRITRRNLYAIIVFPAPAVEQSVRTYDRVIKDDLAISWAPQFFRSPITPILKFLRFKEPFTGPFSSFLYKFVLRGLEIERGEPACDILTLII